MEFTVEKNLFTMGINYVSKSIPNRTLRPILKNVYLEAKEGLLILRGTDGITDSKVTIPANVKKVGAVCVDLMVLQLISYFDDGEVFFKKGKRFSITQGKRKHQPVYAEVEEYPKDTELDWSEDFEFSELVRILSSAQTSVRKQADKEVLQCFHINPHTKIVCTSNASKLSLFKEVQFPGNICNVKSKALMPFIFALYDLPHKVKYQVTFGNWAGIMATVYDEEDGFLYEFETKILTIVKEFPEQIIKVTQDAEQSTPLLMVEFNREELINVLRICQVYSDNAMASGKDYSAQVTIENGSATFDMKIKDLAQMEETLEIKAEGTEPFTYLLRPSHLLEEIIKFDSETIKLNFYDKDKPFLIMNENYTYLQVNMQRP